MKEKQAISSNKKTFFIQLLFLLCFLFINTNSYANDSIVLEDDFDDNALGWYVGETSTTNCQVKEGHYYIQNKNGQSRWIVRTLDSLDANAEDFSIEMKVRQTSGSQGMGFGLMFSLFEDKSAYKKYLISASGQYKIDNFYSGRSHLLANYTEHSALVKGYEFNTIKIVKEANLVAYYINGTLIAKNARNSIYGSRMAFFMGGKMELEIDYVKVTRKKSVIHLVEKAHQIGEKQRLPKSINSPYSELAPILSADGQSMYVCRSGHPENMGGNDIWKSELDENGLWGTLEKMGHPLNNKGHNFVVSVAPDNNQLILANGYRSDGTPGGNGLSITHKTSAGWSVPTKLNIDDFYNRDKFVAYYLCSDNQTMILSVRRNDSYGEKDLYVSFLKKNGNWTAPKNMGKNVNSFENEVNPFVAADNKTLFFASQGHPGYGNHDIFVVKRLDDTWLNWSKPQNLGPKINSKNDDFSYFMDAKGEDAYLGSGGDIWKIENPMKPDPTILIKGRVFNEKTKEPMAVEIKYQDLTDGLDLGIASSDPVTGKYQIVLPAGKKYSYFAEKEGFYAISNYIDLEQVDEYEERTVDLYLKPIEKGEVVRLNNIFFEFDQAKLKNESFTELNRLYQLLAENENLDIEINGHTDDKGSSSYNLELSQKRAESVVNYLVQKGIPKEKLKAVGYGESQPLVANENEENRQFNRRVEFRIL